METERKKFLYIKLAGYVSLSLGIVLSVVSIINYFSTLRFINNSDVIEGVVVRNQVQGTGTLIQHISYIEYLVKDKIYECYNTWRKNYFVYDIGDTVLIRYDVDNPQKAYVNNYGNIYWSSRGLLLFITIFLVIGILSVFFTHFLLKISKNIGTH